MATKGVGAVEDGPSWPLGKKVALIVLERSLRINLESAL
jgi:hypothetical protein